MVTAQQRNELREWLPNSKQIRAYVQALGLWHCELSLREAGRYVEAAADTDDDDKRFELARKAAILSPACTEAYHILAGLVEDDISLKLAILETAVVAGECSLGKRRFKIDRGDFWLASPTRPYMRARFYLACTLWKAGNHHDAVAHMWAMLSLNRNDNQGVREALFPKLLELDDEDGVDRLTRLYKDATAFWFYTLALTYYRRSNLPEALTFAAQAFSANALIPAALEGKLVSLRSSGTYTRGNSDEANYYVEACGNLWRTTPDAVEWLNQVTASS